MTTTRRLVRPLGTLCGGLSVAGMLVLSALAQDAQRAPTGHFAADTDPLLFAEDSGEMRLEWDRSVVLDLDVTSELAYLDMTTREAHVILTQRIRRVHAGSRELEDASFRLTRPDPKLIALSSDEPILIAERLVAKARTRGGAERPFMALGRRLYQLEDGKLWELSQQEWDAIVDPVEVHLSPDGRSYRYQRGLAEFDPSSERAQAVDTRVFDTSIPGASPKVDPVMLGVRSQTAPGRTETAEYDE